MITFEQAAILAIVAASPTHTKKTIGDCLASHFDTPANKAVLSALVDGLAIAGYIAATKGLPTGYVITSSGLNALTAFDEMVEAYRMGVDRVPVHH